MERDWKRFVYDRKWLWGILVILLAVLTKIGLNIDAEIYYALGGMIVALFVGKKAVDLKSKKKKETGGQ